MLLRGELQVYAINLNFENFESTSVKILRVPLYEISEYAFKLDIFLCCYAAYLHIDHYPKGKMHFFFSFRIRLTAFVS